MATTAKLLTVDDLAARWSCSQATVLDHVRNDALPFVVLGSRPGDRSKPGAKFYRFRESDVEKWEAARVMSWPKAGSAAPAPVDVSKHLPTAPGWDGVQRSASVKKGRRAALK